MEAMTTQFGFPTVDLDEIDLDLDWYYNKVKDNYNSIFKIKVNSFPL